MQFDQLQLRICVDWSIYGERIFVVKSLLLGALLCLYLAHELNRDYSCDACFIYVYDLMKFVYSLSCCFVPLST